jgi:hypothetical protein
VEALMAHPYHHALSSVKNWGGRVEYYLTRLRKGELGAGIADHGELFLNDPAAFAELNAVDEKNRDGNAVRSGPTWRTIFGAGWRASCNGCSNRPAKLASRCC